MISEEYIMKKLKEFLYSAEGASFLQGHNLQVVIEKSDLGKILNDIRETFLAAIRDKIPSFRGNSAVIGNYREKEGQIYAYLRIDPDALRRQSLYYQTRTGSIQQGEGVKDILALFTHGYNLRRGPTGYWDKSGGETVYTHAKMRREPDTFLRDCVNKLNARYGGVCQITLDNTYL